MIGFLVGMQSEARLLRGVGLVAVGGATRAGAEAAVARLIDGGAGELVSFGLAAGLDPALRPGDVLVPAYIVIAGEAVPTDLRLAARLGGVTPGGLLHSDRVVATASEKCALRAASGCVALDMETGVLALAARSAGLAFAALRAICDPAERDLPEAAAVALKPDGGLDWMALTRSLLRRPARIGDLLQLRKDSNAAVKALSRRLEAMP